MVHTIHTSDSHLKRVSLQNPSQMTPGGQVQVASAMKEAVKRWHEDLCNDEAIRALVQDEDEGVRLLCPCLLRLVGRRRARPHCWLVAQDLAPMEAKFEPVGNAVQSLVESLEVKRGGALWSGLSPALTPAHLFNSARRSTPTSSLRSATCWTS